MMKLLVTGTSGFIGTSLCERFKDARSFEVVGVDRRPPSERFDSIAYLTADLSDRKEVERVVRDVEPEAVIHLAAQARVDPSLVSASPTYVDNVLATVHLIEAAESLGSKLKRFVYASSETVYGPAQRYPTSEDAALNPQSPYAASKAACELLVTRALGDKALILRSGMGFGPRSDPRAQVVAKFIERAMRNEPLMFPAGNVPGGHPTRDVNYVSNFLDGLGLALSSGANGIFNIASGREISILELAEAVADAVGSGRIEFSPSYSYRRGEEGLRTWLDITRAREAFGYVPRVGLSEGLDRTIHWMRRLTERSDTGSVGIARPSLRG